MVIDGIFLEGGDAEVAVVEVSEGLSSSVGGTAGEGEEGAGRLVVCGSDCS